MMAGCILWLRALPLLVMSFEAALNKQSSLRVEPNRAHQRSDRRWAAPRPVAKIAQPGRRYRAVPEAPRPARTRSQKHNPPKRADNEIDCARVLEVRIQFSPAEVERTLGLRPHRPRVDHIRSGA